MSAVLKPIRSSERSLQSFRHPDPLADHRLEANRGDRSTSKVRPLHEEWPMRAPRRSPVSSGTVKPLPARSHPVWLKALVLAQQGSAVFMLLMVGSVLTVYGWTVHVQQTWGRTYQRFETLQAEQRQMTAAIEMLKHQATQAIDAESSNWSAPRPDQLIFLTPAEPRSPNDDHSTVPGATPSFRSPMGY